MHYLESFRDEGCGLDNKYLILTTRKLVMLTLLYNS